MGWFKNKKEKEPVLSTFEKAKAKKPEGVQKLIDMHPDCFYLNEEEEELIWIKIVGERPEALAHTLDLSTSGLNDVIRDLVSTSNYSVNGWTGHRTSQNSYKLNEVQKLVDYAISLRYATDWMMKKSIEGGIAEYDSEGTFKFKDEENVNSKD